MCCDHDHDDGDLPVIVRQMLGEYRARHAECPGFDWGDELADFAGFGRDGAQRWWDYARWCPMPDLLAAYLGMRGDPALSWEKALLRVMAPKMGVGTVIVTIRETGLEVAQGPRRLVLAGGRVEEVALLVENATTARHSGAVAEERVELGPGEVALVRLDVDASRASVDVSIGGHTRALTIAEVVAAGELVLRSDGASRWEVVDPAGGGWFPAGLLHKHDIHDRPFFHGVSTSLAVPAGRELTVTVSRGIEFERATTTVVAAPGATKLVELRPRRLYDAAARGWYGGDMHVHLNYSGDFVARPEDAARMQAGEGLHLMNLVAANAFTSRVYEREALEAWAGQDLPWSDADAVARWGVEYRNDLLGHLHAFGVTAPPSRYTSGHARSAWPDDWPPNSVACEELRSLGATIGYTHPVMHPMTGGDPGPSFRNPRSVEARELPADAALGLVDSIDLLGASIAHPDGATHLYHRLLNCGLRLAATAGTDVFLSFAHLASFSNPPGCGGAFADLRGERLSVAAWQAAVRAGRTVVTNGPWLSIELDGHGPGDVVDRQPGATLRAVACCAGVGVDALSIVGPDGAVATVEVDGEEATLEAALTVDGPGWFAAVARGGAHPNVLAPFTYAHTSPVHVEVDGRRIGRAADAAWCIDWLARVEDLARQHGTFSDPHQLDELVSVLAAAADTYRRLLPAD